MAGNHEILLVHSFANCDLVLQVQGSRYVQTSEQSSHHTTAVPFESTASAG